MSFDLITLQLAKNYTDEKVKETSTGGVDLSGYAKLEDVPTVEENVSAVLEALPTWSEGVY